MLCDKPQSNQRRREHGKRHRSISVSEIRSVLPVKSAPRLSAATTSTTPINRISNSEATPFGTTSRIWGDNVLFVIVTTAANLMPLLSTLKRDMDRGYYRNLRDFSERRRSGRYRNSLRLRRSLLDYQPYKTN